MKLGQCEQPDRDYDKGNQCLDEGKAFAGLKSLGEAFHGDWS